MLDPLTYWVFMGPMFLVLSFMAGRAWQAITGDDSHEAE